MPDHTAEEEDNEADALTVFTRRLTREQRERAARQTTEGQRVEETDSFTRVIDTQTGKVVGGEKSRTLEPTTEQKAAAGRLTTDFSTLGAGDRFSENLGNTDRDVTSSGEVQRTQLSAGATSVTSDNIAEDEVAEGAEAGIRRQATGGDLEGQANHTLPNLPSVGLLGLAIAGFVVLLVAVNAAARGAARGAVE